MASLEDVKRIALALPETSESTSYGNRSWQVRTKAFVWERPLGKKDLTELGDDAPDGVVLAAKVANEGEKQALVASEPDIFFTTKHFNGYPAVLVRLAQIPVDELAELIEDAWLATASKTLVADFRS